ncbi:MAG TPA: imidazole glycerol phosphate synthase subunit HisH [Acidimicrobiales bacterium]|nr:imidazole glycerol phosphate synthase subunit HisH [Acidimicrobiales bacterium]
MSTRIAVLDYGIGNLRSAEKALQKVGADAKLVADPKEASAADALVLPGVGAFGRCMESLRASGLDTVACDGIRAGKPFLGICIGMQMLYEGSEEDAEVAGLGMLPGAVRRLPEGVKHPQMQWNVLQPLKPASPLLAGLTSPAWAYFVHSYAPDASDDVVATCDYGGSVVAAVERGRLWATQFHPEKSGAVGLRLLSNFVAAAAA